MEEKSLTERIEQVSRELCEVQALQKKWFDEHIPAFKLGELKPLPAAKEVTPETRKRLRELEEREEELLQQLEDLYKST